SACRAGRGAGCAEWERWSTASSPELWSQRRCSGGGGRPREAFSSLIVGPQRVCRGPSGRPPGQPGGRPWSATCAADCDTIAPHPSTQEDTMKKFICLAGLAIGFVIGSRTGRGPYESLERTAHRVAEDPEVQRRAAQAKETAARVAQDTAEVVKEKAPEVAATAQGAVAGAAGSVKERLAGAGEGLDAEAEALAKRSADSAVSGGDAEVGEDEPLSS